MLVEVNDGIIVTAGVVEGLAGAGASAKTILIAGFSAIVGGGIALGGAKYGEEAAELDARLAILEEEQRQLSLSPEDEMAELVEAYERRGLSSRLAHEVAQSSVASRPGSPSGWDPSCRCCPSRWPPMRGGSGSSSSP
jgi:VIT1/CCC1 family predicted Fe2+/Mn2+ transporter